MQSKSFVACVLFLASISCVAGPQIVQSERLGAFDTFVSNDWTRGTASYAPNSIYILRSTGNVSFGLTIRMSDMLGMKGSGKRFLLDSKYFAGVSHARISDTYNLYTGQCVDFVKTMLGNSIGTNSWYPGTKLSDIPANQLADTVRPGTVIAYFAPPDSIKPNVYSNFGKHVAIVLNFTFDSATMKPTGMTVLDQNFLLFDVKVGGVSQGTSPESISRHFLNWNGTGVSGGGNYRILDIH